MQVAHTVAAQAPVQARAGDLGTQKFTCHGQQVIQGQKQGFAQLDHDGFLCRAQLGLQSIRSVGFVHKAVTLFPFVDGGLGHTIADCQHAGALGAGGNLCANRRRSACVLVQLDVHDFEPPDALSCSINPAMTSRAMNNG